LKDLLGAYGKVGGIGAASGFLLSLLIGLFSGNPFGTVLLRALLLALLFAGFGIGAQVVLGRFLPEIAGVPAAGGETAPKKVDIVLPEENPHAAAPGVRVAEPGGTTEDGVAEAQALAEGGRTEEDGDVEAMPSDLPPPGPDEEAASVEEAVEGPAPKPAAAAEPVRPRTETDRPRGAGPLPTLDSLGGAFGSSPKRAAGASKSRADAGMTGQLGGEDPATIARAIRTVLKKDEKG